MVNNNNDTPLWLPTGSIRAILAVEIVTALLYTFVRGREVPDRFWELGILVAGAYFVQKVVQVLRKAAAKP